MQYAHFSLHFRIDVKAGRARCGLPYINLALPVSTTPVSPICAVSDHLILCDSPGLSRKCREALYATYRKAHDMITSQPLRLYANPVKPFLFLLGSLILTSLSFLMLQDPKVQANPAKTVMAYVGLTLFGLGSLLFVVMILRNVIGRQPVLQIDAQGWRFTPSLGGKGQAVGWENIGAITLYQQTLPRGGSVYYLVVYARDPRRLPPTRGRAFAASVSPALAGAAMSIPVNAFFLRSTFAKSKQLLERIASSSAYEIQYYGVQVVRDMQFM